MSMQPKHILVIAAHNKPEALRMASGLTLLDDEVQVAALGGLGNDTETALQLEALEFAEVPIALLDPSIDADIGRLADAIIGADAVYLI